MIKKFLIILSIILLTGANAEAKDLKWQKSPLLVCMPANQNNQLMKQAFREWQRAIKDKVTFKFLTANSCPNAQITVSYAPNKRSSLTTYAFTGNYFTKAHIEMGLLTAQGNKAETGTLLALMKHEIGHAIGLTGHTNTPKSVMQAVVKDGYTITQDSINEIYRIYK